MTFGRSPTESRSPTGSGLGSASGPRADAPYADGAADGFGARGPAPDGFGRPPVTSTDQTPGSGDPNQPVTHAELDDFGERTYPSAVIRNRPMGFGELEAGDAAEYAQGLSPAALR